ncbi:hypothetical protein ACCAA_220041 [Candidatus Accumulibacter aalborgensis]|uniref:Uncharacterized protein n=1 Tax=Candidatus Accumulibacter aalborgensis TaxID=1860102 RepID=A0A1A8XK36_9PROT|nr:hypothetical protein ACCAA_220041 [Candidatus Accumulibacter aalborgensis]
MIITLSDTRLRNQVQGIGATPERLHSILLWARIGACFGTSRRAQSEEAP